MKIRVGDFVKPKERKKPWQDLAGNVVAIFEKPVAMVKLGDKLYPFYEHELDVLVPMSNKETEKFIAEKGSDTKATERYKQLFPEEL